jgi:5-hydroxyisourate hydrolase-like protein (transthyretin family)
MFVLLMPGLAGLGADPLAVRETESAKVENYCITGYAQTAGGSPAIGVIIFLFPYKDEKAFSPIVRDKDGHFRLGCPGGKIDKTGKFAIKFSSDYLKSYQTSKFVLGVFRVDGGADISIGIGEKPGTPIFGFDSFGKDKKLDLTQIFPKIIISLSPEISSIEPSRDIKF